MPAARATVTAPLASARSGSMIPAIPAKARSWVSDIGSLVIAARSASPSMSRMAKASTRNPFWPILSLAAAMPGPASLIGTCEPLSGPPDIVQRARTTSGAPLTSSTVCSAPSRAIRWNVAMNLYSESNGTSASRGYARRVSSTSTPIFAARTTRAASVGSPITEPSSPTTASVSSASPSASLVKSGTGAPATEVIGPVLA